MLIHSVELTNFRQFKSFKWEFETQKLPSVIIVQGTNGSGKSTIIEAINWCFWKQKFNFYTEPFYNLDLLNELAEGEKALAEVRVKFTYDNILFSLKKTLHLKKAGNELVETETNFDLQNWGFPISDLEEMEYEHLIENLFSGLTLDIRYLSMHPFFDRLLHFVDTTSFRKSKRTELEDLYQKRIKLCDELVEHNFGTKHENDFERLEYARFYSFDLYLLNKEIERIEFSMSVSWDNFSHLCSDLLKIIGSEVHCTVENGRLTAWSRKSKSYMQLQELAHLERLMIHLSLFLTIRLKKGNSGTLFLDSHSLEDIPSEYQSQVLKRIAKWDFYHIVVFTTDGKHLSDVGTLMDLDTKKQSGKHISWRRIEYIVTEEDKQRLEDDRLLQAFESRIRENIRMRLQERFGSEWFSKGIDKELQKALMIRKDEEEKKIPYLTESELSYCNIMDYYKLVSFQWELFEPTYKSKSNLKDKLYEVNMFRRAKAHYRKRMTEATRKSGHAAIDWFSNVLGFTEDLSHIK